MKFFKLDLLTLLISLFIISSCKKPDAVGLAIDPSEVINGTLLDTVSINTTTLKDDSIITTNLATSQTDTTQYIAPLAYFKDPVFGTTEANVAFSLGTPGGTSFTKPTGTVTIDSAILVLRYARNFYGDTTSTNYKVNVYQLNEQPVQNYYASKTWSYNPTLIGTRNFTARPTVAVSSLQIVTGAKDTMKRLPPQLRVPMNTAFVRSNILLTDSLKLIGTEAFKRYFKGLYLTLDKAQTTGGPGGNFYLLADSCALNVYYKNTSSTGTIDTVVASFPTSGTYAANIKHDYSGTAIPSALNSTKSAGTVYIQGLAGLRAKIAFPYLATNVKQLLGNATLNRAELIITPVAGTQMYPFLPAPRLTMYRYNIAKQRTYIPDASSADTRYVSLAAYGFGGFYNSTKNEYHFVITGYIQDLISGKTIDYGTFLAPADPYNTGVEYSMGSAYNAGRLVAGGDKTSPYKMKLNIIYTPALVK